MSRLEPREGQQVRSNDRHRILSAALAVVAGLAAGGVLVAQGPVAGTRSGGGEDSVVLTVADYYGSQSPPPGMAIFAARTFEISGGAVTMPLTRLPTGTPSEEDVLRSVASGEYDLGFVGTRVLDQVGVTVFQPLSAPFLIDSYPALAAVVSDPLVTGKLSSLQSAGVVGLALLADEMSLPFGRHGALSAPEDYRGTVVRTDPSDVQTRSLAALGATPVTTPLLVGPNVPFEAYDTTLRHYMERSHAGFARFLTGNTTLWPQTSVIVANQRKWAGLTDQQRGWINEAAAYAARWAAQHAGDQVADELRDACGLGLTVVMAAEADRHALRARVQPLYQALSTGVQTAEVFARIDELVAAVPEPEPALPERCQVDLPDAEPSSQPSPRHGPGRAGELPQGVYRMQSSTSDLIALGAPPEEANGNSGVITWALRDGAWSYTQTPDQFAGFVTSCSGYYDVEGPRVEFTSAALSPWGPCAPPTWSARWERTGDTLLWSDVSVADFSPVFTGPGWTRIG